MGSQVAGRGLAGRLAKGPMGIRYRGPRRLRMQGLRPPFAVNMGYLDPGLGSNPRIWDLGSNPQIRLDNPWNSNANLQ